MARLPRIPDLLTTANLACGVGSILLASQGQLTIACGLIFLAAVFDVFDGLAARALGGGTPLGTQLDSLADMVSFGVAPGMLAYIATLVGHRNFNNLYYPPDWDHIDLSAFGLIPLTTRLMMMAGPLLIVICSCWRLAKFNIDTRQTHGFLGLATPFNAMFWASAVLLPYNPLAWRFGPLQDHLAQAHIASDFFTSWTAVATVALIFGILMLSELPLPSLKFKHKGWKGNEVIFLLMGIGAVLVLLYGVLAVPLILIIYLLSPLWGKLFPKT